MSSFKVGKIGRKRKTARSVAKQSLRCKTVVVLGSTKCGKTSFLRRLLFNEFTEEYKATVEDIHAKSVMYKDYVINLEFVDTCGPFEYPGMMDMNIKRAHVALLLYDATNEESMKVASAVLEMISTKRGPDLPVVFVGTMSDQLNGEDEGELHCLLNKYFKSKPYWAYNHQLVSAKQENRLINGIDKAFELILDQVLLQTPSKELTVAAPIDEPRKVYCCGFICCCTKNA